MAKIVLQTEIFAPLKLCFDLSRSIDLHVITTEKSQERAINGITTGLINLNESVTWRARHFGIWFELTSKITAFHSPNFFTDEMTHGIFKSIVHEHRFRSEGNKTIMTDDFQFESPLGWLGDFFNKVILTSYLTNLLLERNKIIKQYAEGNEWKSLI